MKELGTVKWGGSHLRNLDTCPGLALRQLKQILPSLSSPCPAPGPALSINGLFDRNQEAMPVPPHHPPQRPPVLFTRKCPGLSSLPRLPHIAGLKHIASTSIMSLLRHFQSSSCLCSMLQLLQNFQGANLLISSRCYQFFTDFL